AVTTQERWASPPSSPTIVGNAVDTMVWSSAAKRSARNSAPNTARSEVALCGPAIAIGSPTCHAVRGLRRLTQLFPLRRRWRRRGVRQWRAFGLRQERRGERSENVEQADDAGRAAVAAEADDQSAGDQRPQPRDQPRPVEADRDRGGPHARGIKLGEPNRHP